MTARLFVSGTSKRHKRGVVFSCARHTRAFPGNSTFLLSQPSQKLLQRGYFSLGKSTQKQWTSDTGSLMMLKVVRKSHVINWHTATCSIFCEGCERDKTKIPVTRARGSLKTRGFQIFIHFTQYKSINSAFHLTKLPKRSCPHQEKYDGDLPKNVGLFSKKLPRFFVFLLRFSTSLGEKQKRSPRFLTAKSKY